MNDVSKMLWLWQFKNALLPCLHIANCAQILSTINGYRTRAIKRRKLYVLAAAKQFSPNEWTWIRFEIGYLIINLLPQARWIYMARWHPSDDGKSDIKLSFILMWFPMLFISSLGCTYMQLNLRFTPIHILHAFVNRKACTWHNSVSVHMQYLRLSFC